MADDITKKKVTSCFLANVEPVEGAIPLNSPTGTLKYW